MRAIRTARRGCAIAIGVLLALPAVAPAADEEVDPILAELLDREAPSSEAGSFGYLLDSYGVEPYLHGYVTFEYLAQEGRVNTFDLHYFNVFVGANIRDLVVPEIQLEHEHGEEFEIRFGQVDLRFDEALIVRAGLFLVPFGRYNEYKYPEFLSKVPRSSTTLTHREIIPVAWNDVGVQLRGKWEWAADRNVNWAVYVANGLEQADADPDDGVVDDGGAIRSMRKNFRDRNSSDKAFGGRIGLVPMVGVELGLSAYTGAYTVDGEQRLSMLGVDAGYVGHGFTVEFEGVIADQEVSAGDLEKTGFRILAAYQVLPWLEPVVAYDQIQLDGAPEGDRSFILGGVNLLPFHEEVPQLIVRAFYGLQRDDGADPDDDVFLAQLALGF